MFCFCFVFFCLPTCTDLYMYLFLLCLFICFTYQIKSDKSRYLMERCMSEEATSHFYAFEIIAVCEELVQNSVLYMKI